MSPLREERETPSTHGPKSAQIWAMRLIAVVGLTITSYLAWHARHGGVAGCGSGEVFDCAHVLNSRWSKVFGISVSFPALAVYASLIVTLAFVNRRTALRVREMAWTLAVLLAVAAGGAAVWFISLQVVSGKYCLYCMGAHSCSLALAGLALAWSPLGLRQRSTAMVGGIGATLGLILCQALYVAPSHEVEEYVTTESGSFDSMEMDHSLVQDDAFLAPTTDESLFSSPDEAEPATTVIEGPQVETGAFEAPLDSDSTQNADAATGELGDNTALNEIRDATTCIYVADRDMPVPSMTPEPPVDSTPADSTAAATIEDKDVEDVEPPKSEPRYISILGGRAKLNASHWPIVGSPGAKNVVVELFDYTCSYCRSMNQQLTAVCQRYPGQLSIITLPCPLNRSCNDAVASTSRRHVDACELARLALAVWRIDPKLFAGYHEWLFQPTQGRTASAARAEAVRLVGADRLNAELRKPTVSEYIAKHVSLYKRAGRGTIPKLMLPRATVTGKTSSVNALINVLRSHSISLD